MKRDLGQRRRGNHCCTADPQGIAIGAGGQMALSLDALVTSGTFYGRRLWLSAGTKVQDQ
jgi:hypothetical protein